MTSKNISIDLVYMWVDGNDPKWLEKKQRYMDKKINTVGRYVDNQELKYSLRSVGKHLPWIRKIFIFRASHAGAHEHYGSKYVPICIHQ